MKIYRPYILVPLMLALAMAVFLFFPKKKIATQNTEMVPKITAENCKTQIEVEPADKFNIAAGSQQLHVNVSITNLGHQLWGFDGVPMQLGAAWFDSKKQGPNESEQWFTLPGPVAPGEKIKFGIDITLHPGVHKIWLSPLQPGVMWCFHVGDKPKEIFVNVKG